MHVRRSCRFNNARTTSARAAVASPQIDPWLESPVGQEANTVCRQRAMQIEHLRFDSLSAWRGYINPTLHTVRGTLNLSADAHVIVVTRRVTSFGGGASVEVEVTAPVI